MLLLERELQWQNSQWSPVSQMDLGQLPSPSLSGLQEDADNTVAVLCEVNRRTEQRIVDVKSVIEVHDKNIFFWLCKYVKRKKYYAIQKCAQARYDIFDTVYSGCDIGLCFCVVCVYFSSAGHKHTMPNVHLLSCILGIYL